VAKAEQTGVLTLTLRALGDSAGEPLTNIVEQKKAPVAAGPARPSIVVFRYGMSRGASQVTVASEPAAPPAAEPAPAPIQNPVSVSTAPAASVSVGIP